LETEVAQPTSLPSTTGAGLTRSDDAHRPLGEGPFPLELEKFCWAAFFFPWLWAIRRGAWWVLLVWLIPTIGGPLLRTLIPGSAHSSMVSPSSVVMNAVLTPFVLWLGVNGNRIAWAASAKSELARNGMTLAKLRDGETTWLGFGIITELSVAAPLVVAQFSHSLRFLEVAAVVIEFGSLAVAVYLAMHVGGRLWTKLSTSRSV